MPKTSHHSLSRNHVTENVPQRVSLLLEAVRLGPHTHSVVLRAGARESRVSQPFPHSHSMSRRASRQSAPQPNAPPSGAAPSPLPLVPQPVPQCPQLTPSSGEDDVLMRVGQARRFACMRRVHVSSTRRVPFALPPCCAPQVTIRLPLREEMSFARRREPMSPGRHSFLVPAPYRNGHSLVLEGSTVRRGGGDSGECPRPRAKQSIPPHGDG